MWLAEDATAYLDEDGELDLPWLGQRLRRKLGELVRTGSMSFHDELLAAEPRPIRTLMSVPGIGPKTADRLVSEAGVRGLKSLARAARTGRLQRLHGIGSTRERAWGEAAELLLAVPAGVRTNGEAAGRVASTASQAEAGRAGMAQLPLLPTEIGQADGSTEQRSGPERAA
jgi:hypothetical protein